MDIEQVAYAFMSHCSEERRLSANTLAAYRQDLREFGAFFGEANVEDVTGDRLVDFANHLSGDRRLAPHRLP